MDPRTILARTLASLVGLAACGDDVGGGSGGGSATSGDVGTASTPGPAESSTSGAIGGSTSGGATDSSTGMLPDLPPHPAACDTPEALIDVAVAVTPDGPITVDEAWVWFDLCGDGPFVVLAQRPTIDGGEARSVEIRLQADGAPTPWLGTYPAAVTDSSQAAGTMDLLEPFVDPNEPGQPHPDLHLHARIEIHEAGYALSLEVDLIDCGVWDCSCPCE